MKNKQLFYKSLFTFSDNTIEVGGTGGLSCYGVGTPQPSIKWQRKGGLPLPSHFVQDQSGDLRIKGNIF